jgi:Neisseria PilC beta-propeller domain
MKRTNLFYMLAIFCVFLPVSSVHGEESDESIFFNTLSPDALILLDLSGSMSWTPVGKTMFISSSSSCDTSGPFYEESDSSHSKACTIDTGSVPKWSNTACTGPFYRSSGSGHTTNCSRLEIAKRALFTILDDTDNGIVDSQDEKNLGIRFGYMRYNYCSGDDTGGSYSSGCNRLIQGIGGRYSKIYCNSAKPPDRCSSPVSSGGIGGEDASGGTPLVAALQEAKLYLDYHKTTDAARACRSKFVLLITDGADTYTCGGSGSEDQLDQYKRRRAVVSKTKALADAGYKVFVVGFGADMPHFLRNTLNWMAFHGGTDNSLAANSGDTAAYDPSSTLLCQDSSTAHHNIEGDGDHYYAANDPGEILLSGYAFLAYGSADLTTALKQAVNAIREAPYCFSTVSVASSRAKDENFIYEASFQPYTHDPFWRGHVKKYNLLPDGNLADVAWDAGTVLQSTAPGSRRILTLLSAGGLVPFTTANVSRGLLGVGTDSERDRVVGYFRGDPAYNPEGWKLGDIFHSNPVTVGSPSGSFNDIRDMNRAFIAFRDSHPRTSVTGARIILTPANDGQIHAFRSSDGAEVWSFIPPNLLPKLKNIVHVSHPTNLIHDYFVDGPVSVADAWLGSGDGRSKSPSSWKTLAIFGEGRGGGTYLWSSSSSCDSGFNAQYTSSYPHYCGYYALDVTDTANPVFHWKLTLNYGEGAYLAAPWSRMAMGRVKINGNEKWVGFFGGGYNASECASGDDCDPRGKGFFVVDLSDGTVLWRYTRAADTTMNYSMPGAPGVIDADFDGFIDTAYIGDMGGNLWRFKFCTASDGASCNTAAWSGGRFFENTSATPNPIFSSPTMSKDQFGNSWVFWGTGDKTDPLVLTVQEKFFAVKDNTRSGTYNVGHLQNITSSMYVDSETRRGWYVNMETGEKILADPSIFAGVAYFTSYVPDSTGDPCLQAGTARLYAIATLPLFIDGIVYDPGAGVLSAPADPHSTSGGARRIVIGVGIPTAPILSFKPSGALPPDLYVTISGGSGVGGSTMRAPIDPPFTSNRTNILFWRDGRIR